MPRCLRSSLLLALALLCVPMSARAEDEVEKPEAPKTEGGPSAEQPDSADVTNAADEDAPKLQNVKHVELAPVVVPECKVDDDCALGSICTDGTCTSVRKQRRWIPPFYWHNPEARSGYTYVPPFYFHRWKKNKEENYDTKVVPFLLFSRHTTPTQVADRLWPIFWHTRYLENGKDIGSQTAMLPVFWWQQKKGRAVGAVPLLLTGWQRDNDRDLTEGLVAGIGYYRREKKDTWRVLFPLYWDHEKQGGRIATLFPLFWFHRDGLKSASVFFPLLWRFQNDETGTENLLVAPLFNLQKQRFGRRTIVASLLGGYEKDLDAGRTQLILLTPPFYHRRDLDLDLDVLPPIFGRWNNYRTGSRGLYAGPLVHVADDEGATTTVFPIYWRFFDRRTQRETHLLLPIGGYHQAPGVRGAVIGPAYGWRSENGAESFLDVRSYLSTARKHGQSAMVVLRDLFTGQPFIPALGASP